MHLKTETNLTILATLSEPVPVESHMSLYLKRRKDNKIGTGKKKIVLQLTLRASAVILPVILRYKSLKLSIMSGRAASNLVRYADAFFTGALLL
jgi:hypothetical protein